MDGNETIFPRLLEPVIPEALADTPVVCVLGPWQAGKTTLVQLLGPAPNWFGSILRRGTAS